VGAFGAAIRSIGCSTSAASVFRFAGGVWLEDTATAADFTTDIARPKVHLPRAGSSWSMSSAVDRAPAPSDTTAASASVSAAVSIIISPPTERPMPPIRSGSTSGRRCKYAMAALTSASPPQPQAFGSPSLSPSPRRSKRSTPYPCRASIRAFCCGPLRPGKAITAAPLRDGTYQPWSSSPSAVVNVTSSWATPSRSGGTTARPTCVVP
jgi:hypothetical protein